MTRDNSVAANIICSSIRACQLSRAPLNTFIAACTSKLLSHRTIHPVATSAQGNVQKTIDYGHTSIEEHQFANETSAPHGCSRQDLTCGCREVSIMLAPTIKILSICKQNNPILYEGPAPCSCQLSPLRTIRNKEPVEDCDKM